MARIYISSSYSDLREERQLVSEVVSQLGNDAVGMESYRASDTPPLEFCVNDVKKSSHYIGIFAFRYGSTVNGKSITEWEYDAASEKGLPRFIFVLKNGAPWPTDRIDADRGSIEKFRQRLQNPVSGHIVKEFTNAGELAAHVRSVVELDIGRGEQFPSILPFLCNRGTQRDQLIDALQCGGKPLVCVIHGDERQAHDQFMERLKSRMLPEILFSGTSKPFVTAFNIQWPARVSDPGQIRRMLIRNLAAEIHLPIDSSEAAIRDYLQQFPTPVIIRAIYRADDWEENGLKTIQCFLDLWSKWQIADPDQQLFIFLFVKYPRKKRKGLFTLRLWDKSAQIEDALGKLRETNPHCHVLDSLPDISHQEAEDWARLDEVAKYRPTHLLLQDIQRIYSEWQKKHNCSSVPMEDLAEELRLCLQNGRRANEMVA